MSLRGYCRTLSDEIACKPAIKITRLTTRARTGRRIKRSVKVFTGRINCRTASGRTPVLARAVLSTTTFIPLRILKTPVADDLFVRFQAFGHGHEIAAGLSGANELLAQDQAFLFGLLVLLFFNDEDRVPEGRVGDSRRRNEECRVFLRQENLYSREHSRRAARYPGYRASPAARRCASLDRSKN